MSDIMTFPTRIVFGEGSRSELPRELARLGITRPLVVTDPGIIAAGIAGEIAAVVGGAVVFDGVQANPTEADVLAGLDLFRARDCDGLIGLGGGSPIDAAKAIRLLATHAGNLADYDLTAGGID